MSTKVRGAFIPGTSIQNPDSAEAAPLRETLTLMLYSRATAESPEFSKLSSPTERAGAEALLFAHANIIEECVRASFSENGVVDLAIHLGDWNV